MRSSINSGYRGERRVLNFPHIVFAFNFMTGLLNKQYYSRGLSGRERNFSFYIFDVLKLPVKKKMWVSSNVFQCSNFFQLKKTVDGVSTENYVICFSLAGIFQLEKSLKSYSLEMRIFIQPYTHSVYSATVQARFKVHWQPSLPNKGKTIRHVCNY